VDETWKFFERDVGLVPNTFFIPDLYRDSCVGFDRGLAPERDRLEGQDRSYRQTVAALETRGAASPETIDPLPCLSYGNSQKRASRKDVCWRGKNKNLPEYVQGDFVLKNFKKMLF